MSLPNEAEELLDVLRRRKLDEALGEVATLIEYGITGSDLAWMQMLEKIILRAYHMEGVEGYRERQTVCEEMARAKNGNAQRKAS